MKPDSPSGVMASPADHWADALDHAAVYVENHCVDGEQHGDAIRRLKRPAGVKGMNPWRAAVDEALVNEALRDCTTDASEPRECVRQLIEGVTQIALDPAVSKEARALIERGAAGVKVDGLTHLHVRTRHPQDYVLHNDQDGTRWRGTADGRWVRDDAGVPPSDGGQQG